MGYMEPERREISPRDTEQEDGGGRHKYSVLWALRGQLVKLQREREFPQAKCSRDYQRHRARERKEEAVQEAAGGRRVSCHSNHLGLLGGDSFFFWDDIVWR